MTTEKYIPLSATQTELDDFPTCAEILAEVVEKTPGVAAAVVDHRRATLTLSYDPDILSPDATDKIALIDVSGILMNTPERELFSEGEIRECLQDGGNSQKMIRMGMGGIDSSKTFTGGLDQLHHLLRFR